MPRFQATTLPVAHATDFQIAEGHMALLAMGHRGMGGQGLGFEARRFDRSGPGSSFRSSILLEFWVSIPSARKIGQCICVVVAACVFPNLLFAIGPPDLPVRHAFAHEQNEAIKTVRGVNMNINREVELHLRQALPTFPQPSCQLT